MKEYTVFVKKTVIQTAALHIQADNAQHALTKANESTKDFELMYALDWANDYDVSKDPEVYYIYGPSGQEWYPEDLE